MGTTEDLNDSIRAMVLFNRGQRKKSSPQLFMLPPLYFSAPQRSEVSMPRPIYAWNSPGYDADHKFHLNFVWVVAMELLIREQGEFFAEAKNINNRFKNRRNGAEFLVNWLSGSTQRGSNILSRSQCRTERLAKGGTLTSITSCQYWVKARARWFERRCRGRVIAIQS